MHKISEATIKSIERTTGLTIEQIKKIDLQQEIRYVERRTGKKLTFPKGCRSIEDVDRRMMKIRW